MEDGSSDWVVGHDVAEEARSCAMPGLLVAVLASRDPGESRRLLLAAN